MQHVPIHAAITMRLHPHVAEYQGEPITLETIQAAPTAHTRGTIHRRLQPLLHTNKKSFLLRLPPQKKPHAPAMRPLQCVLQQHVPIHAAITMRFASTCCRTTRANRFNDEKRSQPQPPHTQGIPFTAACSHFTRRNTRFCAPASSSKQTPCNSHAAITIRFVATRTHPCSHYNVICIHTLQNTKGEPNFARNDPNRTRRHTRGTFHRHLQPLYTEKRMVSCSGFLPNTSPIQHSFCNHMMQSGI